MIARLIVKSFGSIWKLKEKCVSKTPLIAHLAKLLYGLYQYENNSSVAWNSKFDSEPCFPHGMKSIFVSGGARVGHNCIIYQQVTIGSVATIGSQKRGSPIIGDSVYIAAGAKIIGSVKVGNNVRIGANAVVFKDVPDNSVVVTGEQKLIIKDEPLDNRFYSFQGRWVYYEKGIYCVVTDEKTVAALSMSKKLGD